MPTLYHGADYNPDQWLDRPDILERDIELMQKAHVNVVSLGIFAWCTLEPEEGRFNLDWMQEIIDRLNREAAEDEARKQKEIEQARLAAEANFNEATGAYSGAYGADGADGVHKEQIDAILAEKDDALRDLIQRTGEE